MTEAVVDFLHPYGYRKGDIIQPNQVRELVVHYATEKVAMLLQPSSNQPL